MGCANMTNEYYYWINGYALGVCALIFIILLSFDAYKAFKRRVDCIPGDSLVLNALIIQLLTFIDDFNLDVNSNDKTIENLQISFLILNSPTLNIRRVMICIFIGYVLPGVVRLGSTTLWDIGALAFPIIWHMGYEVYSLVKVINEQTSSSIHVIMEQTSTSSSPACAFNITQSSGLEHAHMIWQQCRSYRIWFIVSYATLFTALVFLVVLLSCTFIAGKSIRKIISQKVPLALSCCSNCPEKQLCENIENHVLKCWIVSRASQPDYFMARSVFTSFAGVVNTVCFALLLVKWKRELHFNGEWRMSYNLLHWARMVFILIGWIVVLFRWFRAVMYFPRDVRRLFQMEDFWTRSIVDMKNDVDEHLASRLFQEKIELERSTVVNLITTFIRLYSLLFIILLWLSKLMVSLSKACWYLSELAFRLIRPFIMGPEKNALLYGLSVPETDEFSQYKEALDILRMPGEMAYSLWIANISAFKEVENNLKKGFEEAEGTCEELIILMGYKTGTVEDEIPTCLKEEKHFHEVGKSSCKLRAISLIHFMMYFYDGTNYNVIDDSLKAYSQAWWFMYIVDSVDPEGHLASLTAKKEFDTLMKIWTCVNPSNENVSKILLEKKIKSPLKQLMEQCDKEERTAAIEGQQDSIDWMAVAAKISLYKVWKTMDPESSSVNAIDDLRCLLANIMAHCMAEELDKAVIKNCRKWVEEGREKEIFDAAFQAGKAKAVREKSVYSYFCGLQSSSAVRDQTEVVAGERHNITEIESAFEVHRQISSHSPAILEIE